MFGTEKDADEDGSAVDVDSESNAGKLILLVLFFPALLVGMLFYSLLRFGRLRFSVITSIVFASQAITVWLFFYFNVWESLKDTILQYESIGANWPNLITPIILLSVLFGGFIGLIIVGWELREMKKNPHRLQLPGNWMYNFTFRRTPKELLTKKKMISQLKAGVFQSPEKSPLGLNEQGDYAIVSRYMSEANKHTLIVGSSGSGKSITMQSLILNDIMNSIPIILIDMKRDPEFASKVAAWTKEAGGTFHHFVNGDAESYDIPNSRGQAFYDPLKSGSPTSKADMVLGMREYDTASAVYKANMQQLLQVLFAMLRYADKSKAPSIDWTSGGIYQLASAVYGSNIIELAAACEGTPIEAEAEAISVASQGKTGIKHAMDELQGQMRTIVASEYGQWLKLSKDKEKNIDLFRMTQKPGTVIVFSLNSDSEPDFARYIGSMIMSDLTATSANRRNNQITNQVNVYIDEFQAINPSSVAGLLEKSRASRIAMTLAQQSFEQIVASTQNNGEAYLGAILDTCSNFIIHAGQTEDSAERLSKILGKEWVDSYRASNKSKSFFLSINWANKRNQTIQTLREERWKFEPAQFMELSSPDKNNGFKSTAVVINKTCSDPLYKDAKGAVARTVWMIPSDEVLKQYYTPTPRLYDEEEDYQERRVVSAVSEEEAVETPVPNEYDLLAVRAKNKKKYSEDSYDEDYDGGFQWEKVENDEAELTEEDFSLDFDALAPLEEVPEVFEEPKKRSVRDSSSFVNLKNEGSKNALQITPPPQPKAGIPTKVGGIPTRPIETQLKKESSGDFEEEALPPLNFD